MKHQYVTNENPISPVAFFDPLIMVLDRLHSLMEDLNQADARRDSPASIEKLEHEFDKACRATATTLPTTIQGALRGLEDGHAMWDTDEPGPLTIQMMGNCIRWLRENLG